MMLASKRRHTVLPNKQKAAWNKASKPLFKPYLSLTNLSIVIGAKFFIHSE